jgi:hypothetical protein
MYVQIDPKCNVQFLYLATVTQTGHVAAFEVRTGTLYLVEVWHPQSLSNCTVTGNAPLM